MELPFVPADLRLKDIEFLREELGLKLQLMLEETEELSTMQGRVARALEASKEPLRVAVLCLEERSGLGERSFLHSYRVELPFALLAFGILPPRRMQRLPPEREPDQVDGELLSERKAIEDATLILQHTAEQITEQIR